MTQKHTPTPWAIGEKSKGEDAAMVYCDTQQPDPIRNYNLDGARVADCRTPIFLTQEQAEANAAFIVRACNSHAALVAALEKCVEAMQKDAEIGKNLKVWCNACDVLALAKGE